MIFMFLFLLVLSFHSYASVTATIQYPNVQEGQVIELRLSSDSQKNNHPDVQELEQNFHIAGTATSASYQSINGKATASYDFILNLVPKKTGLLTIPALRWDNETTQSLQVNVEPAKDSATVENQTTVSITGEIIEKQVYENSAITYRVQVISNFDFIENNFVPPQIQDAEIMPLEDLQFGQLIRDNTVFRTLTQDYAIFPKRSGLLQIKGAAFQGIYVKQAHRQRPLLDPFIYGPISNPAQEIFIRSDDIEVSVLPRPQSFQNKWWLPAKGLTATQAFSPSLNTQIKSGDSVTRTIEVTALNVMGTQIPDIVIHSSNDFKVYAEKPKKETYYQPSKGVVGQLTQSFVFVPLHDGNLTLPEINISWFDTVTGQEKTNTLEAQQIIVLPNQQITNDTKIESEKKDEKKEINNAKTQENPYEKENNFLYFIAGLCTSFIFIVIFLIIFVFHPRKKSLPDLYPKD